MLVPDLQRFRELIRPANFDVALKKILPIVADPVEHFLAVLLEEAQLKALVQFHFLDVPDLQEVLLRRVNRVEMLHHEGC